MLVVALVGAGEGIWVGIGVVEGGEEACRAWWGREGRGGGVGGGGGGSGPLV